ncbi:MAG: hypothetical protein ACOYMG_11770 [Candidatus Methylumidiphilus sp.]
MKSGRTKIEWESLLVKRHFCQQLQVDELLALRQQTLPVSSDEIQAARE